jgi:hypothetical protein
LLDDAGKARAYVLACRPERRYNLYIERE